MKQPKRALRRGPGRRTEDLPKDLLLVLTMLWDEQVRLTRIREIIYETWNIDLIESRISYICTHHLRRSYRYATQAHQPILRTDRRLVDRGVDHDRRRRRDRRLPVGGLRVICGNCFARFNVFDLDSPIPCPECATVRIPPALERKIS